MKNRLVELLTTDVECDKDGHGDCSMCEYKYADDKCAHYLSNIIADFLLANGVIVLPCNVGDTVYVLVNWCDYTNCHFEGCAGCSRCNDKGVVERRFHYSHLSQIGKTIFLTKEEAEAKMKGGKE